MVTFTVDTVVQIHSVDTVTLKSRKAYLVTLNRRDLGSSRQACVDGFYPIASIFLLKLNIDSNLINVIFMTKKLTLDPQLFKFISVLKKILEFFTKIATKNAMTIRDT